MGNYGQDLVDFYQILLQYFFFFILLAAVLFICIEKVSGFIVIVHNVDVVMLVNKSDQNHFIFMAYKG